jgi:hypothetical protein
MAKKKILTRDEKVELVRTTFKEVDTTTRVKAWVFIIEKKHYVVIKYNAPRLGESVGVYTSNRKGIKTSDKAIFEKHHCTDHEMAFENALQILIPEELDSELNETNV